jgi:hypothetical protein
MGYLVGQSVSQPVANRFIIPNHVHGGEENAMRKIIISLFLAAALSVTHSATTSVAVASDYSGTYKLLRDTALYPKPQMNIKPIGTLTAGSKVTLSGRQESVLAEATDASGRKGWVSIQDIAW